MLFDSYQLLKPSNTPFKLDYSLSEKERGLIDEKIRVSSTLDLLRDYNRSNSLVNKIALIERSITLVREAHPLVNAKLIESFELLKQYDNITKVNTVINLKINTDKEVIKLGLKITKNSRLIIALKGLFLLYRMPEL